jgi:mono/diheme cytochrome c family protein
MVFEGGEIYIKNCQYCHGDRLDGKGPFADGLNPTPLNFQDVGTIAQLQESYVFWRITTGGPGLPKEAAPWISAMPVWEDFLTEDEVWKVILFMYDYTGKRPRSWAHE